MEFLDTPQGRRIAYDHTPGRGPCAVFLGGFRSDMTGTKALHLGARARAEGRAFLRLDYSGHGASGGRFETGCIGDWTEDALSAIDATVGGPMILIGSSMGGWIAMLIAHERPGIAGFLGIAAAPDFTARMLAAFSDGQRRDLAQTGQTLRPSDYGEPDVITRRLIEDGAAQSVLTRPAPAMGPVRLLQGTDDADVPTRAALDLLTHLGGDARLTLVAGADHRFSGPAELALIDATLADLLGAAEGGE